MELRDYQLTNAAKVCEILHQHKLAYLAQEVRTGKTLTALHALSLYGSKSAIFFTKKKAVSSVESDYSQLNASFKLVVTNYEQIEKYNPADYDTVIVDEAQNFGAFAKPSGRMLSMRKFCVGKPVILLSGTPSPESYAQLFHQLAISTFSPYAAFMQDKRWGFTHSFYRWARAGYVEIKKKRIRAGLEVDDYTNANGDLIWKDIKHLFVRFTQEEAGFQATVEEIFLTVDMADQITTISKELDRDHIYESPTGIATVNSGADLITKLAQVSSGTLIFDDQPKGVTIDWTKADYIRTYFFGKKIAVFYRFKAEFELLKYFFPDWTDVPEEFNASNKTFLGQIASAREGVNLSSADCLVMYNIDFSATSYWQVRARLQTKDRTKAAQVFWVFRRGGIEWKIYKAVSNKKNFTYSYYAKNVRKQDTGSDQKRIGTDRLVSASPGGSL